MSLTPNPPASTLTLREKLRTIITHPQWEKFIMAVIIFNALTLGMQTSKTITSNWGNFLHFIDNLVLIIFVVEIVARIFVYRLAFFTRPWNWFDFIIVGIALLPTNGNLSVLRAFRILRALRLVSTVDSMRRVVDGLLTALPGMASIMALMGLIFYVFAVMSTMMFGEKHPDLFGTLGESFFTLFQVMTLESWSTGVARLVMVNFPNSWIFFAVFILTTTFAVLNLFIGIIVDAMSSEKSEELMEDRKNEHDWTREKFTEVLNELKAVRAELDEIKQKQGEVK